MTEAEWLASCELEPFLQAVARSSDERKLRLFACACARTVWHLMEDVRSRQAVETAERFADGWATDDEAVTAGEAALQAERGSPFGKPVTVAAASATVTLRTFVAMSRPSVGSAYLAARMSAKRAANALSTIREEKTGRWREGVPADKEMIPLLRDVFGNPFRPVTFNPAWRTDTAVSLARAMYESREFSATPILADALQDAGCDNDEVLNHCRGEGLHVRGCWVIDLVLGKEEASPLACTVRETAG